MSHKTALGAGLILALDWKAHVNLYCNQRGESLHQLSIVFARKACVFVGYPSRLGIPRLAFALGYNWYFRTPYALCMIFSFIIIHLEST